MEGALARKEGGQNRRRRNNGKIIPRLFDKTTSNHSIHTLDYV